jgi:hypothetical protein
MRRKKTRPVRRKGQMERARKPELRSTLESQERPKALRFIVEEAEIPLENCSNQHPVSGDLG